MKGLILLAAGGTGGHLFPAEALAHELKARGYLVDLVTDGRAARYAEHFPSDNLHVVRSATVISRNPVALTRTATQLVRGVGEARRLIRRLKPDAVVGFGGYPTVPPIYTATRLAIPTIIHEQNAVMGRANRLLASRVDAIAGGFLPQVPGIHTTKTMTTGNPVRPPVLEAARIAYQPSADGEEFRLVVFGGSQGARFFSKALPEALAQLPESLLSRLVVTQQARKEDEGAVRAFYEDRNISADIAPFFNDMAERIGHAHLVISRSGASTVSELSVIGRPAILVPYPYALDHDQAANASALMAKGGAQVIMQKDLNPGRLAAMIGRAMREPKRLIETAASAKAAGQPDAAALLATMVEAIAGGMTIQEFKERRA